MATNEQYEKCIDAYFGELLGAEEIAESFTDLIIKFDDSVFLMAKLCLVILGCGGSIDSFIADIENVTELKKSDMPDIEYLAEIIKIVEERKL